MRGSDELNGLKVCDKLVGLTGRYARYCNGIQFYTSICEVSLRYDICQAKIRPKLDNLVR